MGYFTREQVENYDAYLARKGKARRPMTNAERQARHVAKQNDVGEIPRIRHRRVRRSCERDLLRFGLTYFGGTAMLKHAPSGLMVDSYIRHLQAVVLNGGQFVVELPRGSGKTTWMVIAIVWALLYGHKRFGVLIAASGKMARKILKNIVRIVTTNERIVADFPAVSVPLSALGGVSQRAASQTYRGKMTYIEMGVDTVKFATLRDDAGDVLDVACGATLVAVGKGAAVKGQNELGERPDIVLLDDPQTRKDAMSASASQSIDEYIHDDVLGLAGHDAQPISCMVTVTPVRRGDIATRLVSPALHPGWIVVVQPFVVEWPEDHERLVAEFLERYADDAAHKDESLSRSRAWYGEHRNEFEGMRVLDDSAFSCDIEADARHHVLNLIGKHGLRVFRAQYQMDVSEDSTTVRVTEDVVASRVNGYKRGVLPPGVVGVTCYVDVNIKEGAGLSWVCLGIGKRRTAVVVDYGRYPQYGALVEPGASPTRRDQAVAAALSKIVGELAAKRFTRPGLTPSPINAVCVDRGWSAQVVTRTLAVVRKTKPLPFALLCSVGRGFRNFAANERKVKRFGDHIVARESLLGDFLEIHTDYWRELAQSGFVGEPLTPGSTSLWGKDPAEHLASGFAAELVAEKLAARYKDAKDRDAWDWEAPNGPNHYGDAYTGALAVASWFGFYDATNAVVDLPASGGEATAENALAQPDPWDAPESGLPEKGLPPSASAPRVGRKSSPRPKLNARAGGFFKGGYW